MEDKIAVFNYLIKTETQYLRKLLIINRLFCFKIDSRILSFSLNLNYLIFGLKCVLKSFKIGKEIFDFKVEIDQHKSHYNSIKSNSINHSFLP
jgi:hypothetical protein